MAALRSLMRMQMRRRLSIALALAALATGGGGLGRSGHAAEPGKRPVPAANPFSRADLPWWRQRHEAALERVRHGDVGLLWLGDSITQNWEKNGPPDWADFQPVWRHFYGDRQAVNLGFKGDTTASLLWRIQNGEVAGISPKAAVILIGANNFGRVHWSAADTLVGIDAIIAELHRRLPGTKLLLLSVLPSERSAWITESTATLNAALAERYGHASDVTYVDVTPLFMKGGRLDLSMFYDKLLTPPDPPLHPTAQAQAQIAARIEPTLARMMGDRAH